MTRNGSAAAALLFVAAVSLFLYAPFLNAYLWADDFGWLTVGQTFDMRSTLGFLHRTHFYRPLVEVYFGLAFALFGYSPPAFHALSIALHIVNASLVFAIGRRVLGTVSGAGVAALFFAVQPAIIEAVAWVSAATALLMTTAYLTAVLSHLIWLDTRRPWARTTSLIAFIAAVLSHEAAVTLLPMLILTELMATARPRPPLRDLLRRYAPLAVILGLFLVVSFAVNRGNYVVAEGSYRIGLHAIGNVFQYLTALYVGRQGLVAFAIDAVALLLLARFGAPAVKLGTIWMVMALIPYSFFTYPGGGRYLYLSAVGFSLLLAGVIQSVSRTMNSRAGRVPAAVTAIILVTAIAGRFAVFVSRDVPRAIALGEPYRTWIDEFRRSHPELTTGTTVTVDDPRPLAVDPAAVPSLVRLAYDDTTLEVGISATP